MEKREYINELYLKKVLLGGISLILPILTVAIMTNTWFGRTYFGLIILVLILLLSESFFYYYSSRRIIHKVTINGTKVIVQFLIGQKTFSLSQMAINYNNIIFTIKGREIHYIFHNEDLKRHTRR